LVNEPLHRFFALPLPPQNEDGTQEIHFVILDQSVQQMTSDVNQKRQTRSSPLDIFNKLQSVTNSAWLSNGHQVKAVQVFTPGNTQVNVNSQPTSHSQPNHSLSIGMICGIVVGAIVIVIAIVVGLYIIFKRRNTISRSGKLVSGEEGSSTRNYSLEKI